MTSLGGDYHFLFTLLLSYQSAATANFLGPMASDFRCRTYSARYDSITCQVDYSKVKRIHSLEII